VVVNQRQEIDKDGKSRQQAAADAELKQISDLVKEAMGFNKDRGDTISVANAPFTVIEKGRPDCRPGVTRKWFRWSRNCSSTARLPRIIAYLLLGVVRPLLKTMLCNRGSEGGVGSKIDLLATEEGEEGEAPRTDPDRQRHAARTATRRGARAGAAGSTQAVANIIREWTGANAS
jgi:flagellar M-ring protein FliF